ncbi:uncharacterized protein [Struthio camelus]|uniref:uncharacterized protein isoform X2 n=1 Tax=Struthio camelus TaxID=8801 RepID=UPI003603FE48
MFTPAPVEFRGHSVPAEKHTMGRDEGISAGTRIVSPCPDPPAGAARGTSRTPRRSRLVRWSCTNTFCTGTKVSGPRPALSSGTEELPFDTYQAEQMTAPSQVVQDSQAHYCLIMNINPSQEAKKFKKSQMDAQYQL